MLSAGERISESKATILIVVAVRLGSVPLQNPFRGGRPDGGDELIADGQARTVAGTNSPGMIWVQAIRFENHPSAGQRHRTEFIFVFSFSKTSAGSVGCLRKQRLFFVSV
jgi:hypothetical protein